SLLREQIGQESEPGDWLVIDQDSIDAFAEVTRDRQFIHVDSQRCAEESPYGKPIAHGFFSLSLVTFLTESIPQGDPNPIDGADMLINYGLDRVRFPTPVVVDSKVRASRVLLEIDRKSPEVLQ